MSVERDDRIPAPAQHVGLYRRKVCRNGCRNIDYVVCEEFEGDTTIAVIAEIGWKNEEGVSQAADQVRASPAPADQNLGPATASCDVDVTSAARRARSRRSRP